MSRHLLKNVDVFFILGLLLYVFARLVEATTLHRDIERSVVLRSVEVQSGETHEGEFSDPHPDTSTDE
jgi:hypothetical protein